MITDNKIQIIEADLNQADHAENFLRLTAEYMADPMGEAEPWSDEQKNTVIKEMKDHPGALVVFAKADNEYIGICTCFYAYSTFLAKPLLNIHDIYVSESYRSNGIGRKMIEAIVVIAREKGCGKITLEVRKDNLDARDLYKRQGFKEAPHSMFFWIKYL